MYGENEINKKFHRSFNVNLTVTISNTKFNINI